METVRIDILNPKVKKLLQGLADMNLITIKQFPDDNFLDVVSRLRKKASAGPPTMEEISNGAESVRTKRYAQKKR